jgi:hypothetical protein
MKLSQIGAAPKMQQIVFIGELSDSGIVDREGEPYYVGKLAEVLTIRCSTDPEVGAIEVEELYIRKQIAEGDDWTLIDEKDPAKGFTIPNYKADWSTGQEVGLFQETTIAAWIKGSRKDKREENRSSMLQRIEERRRGRK